MCVQDVLDSEVVMPSPHHSFDGPVWYLMGFLTTLGELYSPLFDGLLVFFLGEQQGANRLPLWTGGLLDPNVVPIDMGVLDVDLWL